MCCNVTVLPAELAVFDGVAEELLHSGLFHKIQLGAQVYHRQVEDGLVIATIISNRTGQLNISLAPAITMVNQHHPRVAGSVMFEIAAKYAEKVQGRVVHNSRVGPCNGENSDVAQYPNKPLQWENVCRGFRVVMLGEGSLEP